MDWQIPLADLDLGAEEEAAVLAVLRRQWLTMGEETERFEAEFAAMAGTEHAIAVTNCTAALHLAGLALGWGPGDEVIVPALTFVATANAVTYTGARPVFADVTGPDDFSIDPDDVAAKITPRTRAIIPVHYGGYACDMPRLQAMAEAHDLAIVEDAAHAPGATLQGRGLGSWGDIGCFSFFSNKNMTTGEGGMLATDDEEVAERLRLLRSHGMTTLTWERHKGHAFSYDVTTPGYNFRIDEVRAALGRVQLGKLEAANRRRRQLNQTYEAVLAELAPEAGVPYQNHPGVSAGHIRPILLPPGVERRTFMERMKAAGIQTSIHYPPIHQFSHFRVQAAERGVSLPVTEAAAAREVTLPLYPGMTAADVARVGEAVREALPGEGDG
jgi:dTDP-4-amino-4,6-dideoxygalactose transaminase